jgi:hypothetical protein
MKVNVVTPMTQAFERISGKTSDKQEGAGQNAYERQQKKDEKNENRKPPTPEELQQAVDVFAHDTFNAEHGITAESQGQGPGLRVILKDAGGGVLRNVSGDEFLKLRETVRDGKKSGRILDQKA